ncbi:MAG TPA: YihY/virulence factor BrkB family protein, partial [Actinotalea sp.]
MSRDESSRSAPAPDDPRKPASPQDLTKRSWSYTARKTMREFNRDQCTDLAAALTYYSVLAVAPAALALVSLLGVFGNGGAIVDKVMEAARGVAPGSSLDTIDQILTNLTSKQGTGIGVAIGLLIALWSASGYVNAFGRAMNRIYEVDEGRPLWKLRPTMLLVTLVVLVLVALICVALVLSGGVAEVVGKAVGLSAATVTVWNIAKWPVVLVLVIVIIAVLYYATPNVRQPKLRWVSVGSVVALLVWAVATALFGVYVARSSSYDATYGTLAGMIIFLLWVWLTNNALLFGAELDAELERARELQAGIAAERTIQLPPRDTEASVKKQTKLDDDIADGRALRESRG